jgi:hypothetical protein
MQFRFTIRDLLWLKLAGQASEDEDYLSTRRER